MLFSDAMQNMHAVGQAQMTNLPVFNMPGSYNLFKPRKDSAGLKRKRNEEETVGESSTGKKARKQAEEDADEL